MRQSHTNKVVFPAEVDGCVLLAKLMKTISSPPPAPISVFAFASDTILPGPAAPSVILDKGGRLSDSAHRLNLSISLVCYLAHRLRRYADQASVLFRVARVFLSGLIDSGAFHNHSLGREVSVLFTSTGPVIYRWESKNEKPPARS